MTDAQQISRAIIARQTDSRPRAFAISRSDRNTLTRIAYLIMAGFGFGAALMLALNATALARGFA